MYVVRPVTIAEAYEVGVNVNVQNIIEQPFLLRIGSEYRFLYPRIKAGQCFILMEISTMSSMEHVTPHDLSFKALKLFVTYNRLKPAQIK